MKFRSAMTVALFAILSGTGAGAAPVSYEGTLLPGQQVTGSIGGFSYFLESVSQGIDFWRFFANAGSTLRIEGDRLNSNLDPAFSLYFGLTSADTSLFSASSNWGGLTFLASADDEIPRNVFNGDPLLANFIAPFTGNYTVAIGGFLSTDGGQYPYGLVALGVVPTPATLPLLAVACLALLWTRMRAAKR